jgi:hypothetical protein
MSLRISFALKSVLALMPLAVAVSACSSAASTDDGGDSSNNALSQSECDKIVSDAVTASKAACTKMKSDADAQLAARTKLETNVVASLGGFEKALLDYGQDGVDVVAQVVGECQAVECRGEQISGQKLDCPIERGVLELACYVSHADELKAAATSLDFDSAIAGFKSAVSDLTTKWGGLKLHEIELRTEAAACNTYAGSALQKTKLNTTCRASCDAADATTVSNVGVGQGTACAPPGFDGIVKDDTGKTVDCGLYKRPIWNVGTVCECQAQDSCTQWSAAAGVDRSVNHRGESCGNGKTNKLVWDSKAQKASIKCQ